ncbi:MAG: CoA pyrophosphatase [Candidatus Tumulicola sp.]
MIGFMRMRRRAAVVIAIFRAAPHGIVFVERAAHLRDHPGQIGLPGGGVNPEDRDLEATALRELHEEVGIEPARATIVAELPMLQQRLVNNFDVTTFVAIVEAGALTIDAAETAGVFVVPLATLLEQGVREGRVDYAGVRVQSLVLDHDGHRIWGLTARILRSFVVAWVRGDLRERVTPHLIAGPNAAAARDNL